MVTAAKSPLFDAKILAVIDTMNTWIDRAMLVYPLDSGEGYLAQVLSVVVGAACESQRKGNIEPLSSLFKTMATWAASRSIPDGRKVGDVAAELMSKMKAGQLATDIPL